MKDKACFIIGTVGAWLSSLFGGWNGAMTTLIVFMLADYVTGLVVAAVFKKSPKTKTGALQSNAGVRGIIKKCMMLMFVAITYRLDLMMGSSYIRDACVACFCVNELVSITENLGIMGVPFPDVVINAIDVLKDKNPSTKTKNDETKNDKTKKV